MTLYVKNLPYVDIRDNYMEGFVARLNIYLIPPVLFLLDFSKIEAGRMMLRVAPHDIVEFARHYVGMVRGAMDTRGIALALEVPTDRVLAAVNEIVCRSTVRNNYVTAFFARIDKEHNTLRYSSAGHMPPFLYRMHGDEFILLQTRGRPLGWFNAAVLEEKEIALRRGDRIIFYTDGIIECRNPEREIFGEERFKSVIRQYRLQE